MPVLSSRLRSGLTLIFASVVLALTGAPAHAQKRCGDDLTRANVMRQMLSLKDYTTPLMLPGVSITTGPDDYGLYGASRLQRFDGKSWVPFGDPVATR